MIINGNMITASDGKVLKKGDVIATVIHLGVNDSVDNWTEIDKPEAEIPDSEVIEIITGGDSDAT